MGAIGLRCDIGSGSTVNSASTVALAASTTVGSTGIVATVRVIVALAGRGIIPMATVLVFCVMPLLSMMALALGRRIRNRSWNGVRGLVDVKFLVDGWRNRLDFRTELLLDLVQVKTVFPVDEVDRQAKVTKTSRTTDSVKVGLCILGEIEIDDDVNGLDINTSSQEIGAN